MNLDALKHNDFFALFAGLAPELVADRFDEEIRTDLLNRPEYRSWVRKMDTLRSITRVIYPQGKQRGELLNAIYNTLRFLDDVADGYRDLPDGYDSSISLLNEVIDWVKLNKDGVISENPNPVCVSLAQAFSLAQECGFEVYNETLMILQSVLYDACRREKPQFCPNRELEDNYYDRDIVGVQSVCLKLCGGNVDELPKYAALGKACRICDNLKDFDGDCAVNIINIPHEDAERIGISLEDLNSSSPNVQKWMREQVAMGMSLLDEHHKQLATMTINPMIRAVLYHGYERPTRKVFQRMQKKYEVYIHASPITLARTPLQTTIATIGTRHLSAKHRGDMDIHTSEWERYWKKSWNLALCYNGFSDSRDPRTYYGAAKAAFLCCAYDVATDWREFDEKYLHRFERLLQLYGTKQEQDIAMNLYRTDQAKNLAEDGLERGWAALEFIVSMMGIRSEFEEKDIDIHETGLIFQIVDDVLDVEEDEQTNEDNCLLTPRRDQYLQQIINTDIHAHFDPKSILCVMIEQARLKAMEMASVQ